QLNAIAHERQVTQTHDASKMQRQGELKNRPGRLGFLPRNECPQLPLPAPPANDRFRSLSNHSSRRA
ncbi:MAG TPA: hypothetical protein VNY10_15060, partial [Roseiarcus sp.]|nr:hypothetical protein [Roseiarcus sp.]